MTDINSLVGDVKNAVTSYPTTEIDSIIINFEPINMYRYTLLLMLEIPAIKLTTEDGVKGNDNKINKKLNPLVSTNRLILTSVRCLLIYAVVGRFKKFLTIRNTE